MPALRTVCLNSIPNADAARDSLATANSGLFFHSSARINFLKRYLQAEDISVAACIDNRLVGYLNMLVKQGPLGKVANSSPYFGSNGGIILDLGLPAEQQQEIKQRLLAYYQGVAQEHQISLTCLITNPLYADDDFYRKSFGHHLEDYRIGQLTPMPGTEDEIFALIHSKTRNLVRKAQKAGFEVYTTREKADVDFMIETHRENMEQIGGCAKEREYFEQSLYHSDYPWRLWVAARNGERAAAMLLYVYGGVIEYVTPVIKASFRSEQPLSLLIFEAMKTAVKDRAKWWNWGGTWRAQEGVYHFKSRWGARDMNYYYFVRFSQPGAEAAFLSSTQESLLSEYRYFFTVPFDQLRSNATAHAKP